MKIPQIEALPGMTPLGMQPAAAPAPKIRLMKYYVTDGTTKARCWYSRVVLIDGRDCVTIYGKNYSRDLGAIFGARVQDDTDAMTDYFENSRVRIFKGDPLWEAACAIVGERTGKPYQAVPDPAKNWACECTTFNLEGELNVHSLNVDKCSVCKCERGK